MLRSALVVGVLLVSCGNDGGASGGGDGSDDPGGAAGESGEGGAATGGTSGALTGGSAGSSSGGDGTGGATGGSAGTAGMGGEGGSSSGSGGAGGSGGGGDPCGGTDGPEMVELDGFCIDSTEVTNGQYARFMDAVEMDPVEQPAACSWNDSFVPNATSINEGDDYPVRGVDWCDAHAYCAWAGKALCGSPAGSEALYDEPANEEASLWFRACSANGTSAFPYGDAEDAQACNGADYGDAAVGPLPVASIPTCEGGYPGIFDMSGNVWEWENSCDASVGATDFCRARGGAFGNGGDLHRCDYAGFSPERNFNAGPTGIRCCSR